LTACVLDTDVVIAALDRHDAHHRAAAEALTTLIEADAAVMLSTVNYAEALVRPAEDERTLQAAIDAIAALRIRLVAPTPAIAREAARRRGLGISLADGFAVATAQAHNADLATFDRRVRRALKQVDIRLAPAIEA
jgi:predicted nucleic acid-binding protein